MRRKSGIIIPGRGPHVNEIKEAPEPVKLNGCLKRRRQSHVDTKHCICGLKLKTRRGETRCPTHGTAWAAEYWELTEVTADE